MTERYGPGLPVNAMAEAISRTNQFNISIEMDQLRKRLAACETAFRLAQTELSALRLKEPIADACVAKYTVDVTSNSQGIALDMGVYDAVEAYLAAQEGKDGQT